MHRRAARENEVQGIRRAVVWTVGLMGLAVVAGAVYVLRQRLATPAASEPVSFQAANDNVAQTTDRTASRPAPPSPQNPVSAVLGKLERPSSPRSAKELVSQLTDPAQPLQVRRKAAWALGRIGSDEAIDALKRTLVDGPSYLKAAIAEGLGQSTHPDAVPMLRALLEDREEAVARGAIRGFAARGDASSVEVLSGVLRDAARATSLRTEAALVLGEVNLSAASDVLTKTVLEGKDETLTTYALEGLGKRPFEETRDFFRDYLEAPSTPAALRAAALEALSQASGEVAPFLLHQLKSPDAEVRAAAALALSATESHADAGKELARLLPQETDPAVRVRLYQALGNQGGYDLAVIQSLTQTEPDTEARLAGFDLLAASCRNSPVPEALAFFEQTAVPELQETALKSSDSHQRLSSVTILLRAKTPQAWKALAEIGRLSNDPKVVKAASPGSLVGARRKN